MRRRRTLVCLPRIENLDPRAAKVFEVSVGQSGIMATADGGDLRIEPNNRQARTMKAGISAAESLVMNWRRRCCAADLGMSAVVPSASSAPRADCMADRDDVMRRDRKRHSDRLSV
jgi:hypothetical protein